MYFNRERRQHKLWAPHFLRTVTTFRPQRGERLWCCAAQKSDRPREDTEGPVRPRGSRGPAARWSQSRHRALSPKKGEERTRACVVRGRQVCTHFQEENFKQRCSLMKQARLSKINLQFLNVLKKK